MSTQPNEMTEEELFTALDLLVCISSCTDSDFHLPWHQQLQQSIHQLLDTITKQQENTAIEKHHKTVVPA